MKKHPETLAYTEQLTNEEWLEIRRKGIGGSDAGTVLGKNPYKSPLTLWAEKRNELPNEFKGNEATAWGHLLEEPIAKRFAEEQPSIVLYHPMYAYVQSKRVRGLESSPLYDTSFRFYNIKDWYTETQRTMGGN